ncbi:right-handed parallel beta-helix repeat-containing protein [Victivallis vadensis]|uniref:right-handed parallel beta-helix repeat-containing protein n=1 Tax=Victivallis vadensis TaxID=172901 RepID=UPI00307E5432
MATYYVYADEAARQAAIQAGEAAENNSFTSIQTAINQSADGDTIQIGAGTFDEKITVGKAVTLQGAADHGTVVTNGFGIYSDGVTIRGFNIQPQTANYGSSACGIYMAYEPGQGHNGFGADGVLSNLTVEDNIFDCTQFSGSAYGVNMTQGGKSADVTITGNRFVGATAEGTKKGQDAFFGGNLENFVFDNNTIDGFKHHGVSSSALTGNSSISGNTVTNLDRNGIQVDGACSGTVTVQNNIVDKANQSFLSSLSADDGAIVLRGKNADGSVPTGFDVTGNTVTNSKVGVYVENSMTGTDVAISGNTISDNKTAIQNKADEVVDAVHNDWGTTDPAELGNSMKGQVDFSNFITGYDDDNQPIYSELTIDYSVVYVDSQKSGAQVVDGKMVMFYKSASTAISNAVTGTVVVSEATPTTSVSVPEGITFKVGDSISITNGRYVFRDGQLTLTANDGGSVVIDNLPEGVASITIADGSKGAVTIDPSVSDSVTVPSDVAVKVAVNWPADFFGADAPASAEQLVPAADRATFGTGNDAVVNFTSDYTLYGTAAQASDADAKTWLYVQNSTIRNGVFGGSLAGRVGTSNIYVQDSSISAVYGGGQSFQALDGTFTGSTTGTANVYVSGGEIGEVFGGADGVGSTVGAANVTNSDIAMFYVGTYSKDGSGVNHITGTLTANLTDSRIGNQLIVAGRLGGTRDMGVTIHEVIVNAANSNLGSGNVMLGGFIENEGADLATGKHTLTVDRVEFNATAGTVMQHFYAGGRADNGVLTVKEAVISLENSTSGNIYGGGYSDGCGKNIVENVTITVGTGSTVRNVIAGGHNAGSTVENATVEIAGGTVQYSVYGGGNNAAVENATVILSGGAVAGDVKAGNVAGSQSVGSAQVVFKGSAYTSVAGTVSGAGADRSTLVFDAFTGNLDLKVQGFTGVEVRSGSKVTFGDNVDLSTVNSLAITIDAAPAEALVSFGDKLNALNELAVTVGTLAAGNWILASGVTLASGAVITLNNTAVAIGAEMILLPGDMLGQLLLVDGNLSINVEAAPQPTLDHIAVSPAYTTADETFTLNGEFYKVGTNAFSTLSEAVSAAEENSVLTVAGANYGSAALNINASQTWKAGDDAAVETGAVTLADGVVWTNNADVTVTSLQGGSLVLGTGAALTWNAAGQTLEQTTDITGPGTFTVNAAAFYADGKAVTLGGTVGNVYGSGLTGTSVDSVELSIAGSMTGNVYGLASGAAVTGSVTVNRSADSIGSSYNTQLAQSNNTIGAVRADADYSAVIATLNYTGGTHQYGGRIGYGVDSVIYGSTLLSVSGNTRFELDTKTNPGWGDLLTGGYWAASRSVIHGNTAVEITGAASVGKAADNTNTNDWGGNIIGGSGGEVKGDSRVLIDTTGEINLGGSSIIGGGSWSGTVRNSSVTINNGTVSIYRIKASNGTYEEHAKRGIYGGSYGNATTSENASITINGGVFNGILFYAGSQVTNVKNATITINGGVFNNAAITDSAAAAALGKTELETCFDGTRDRVTGESVLELNVASFGAKVQNFHIVRILADVTLSSELVNIDRFDIATGKQLTLNTDAQLTGLTGGSLNITAGNTLTLDAANADLTLGSDVTGDGKFVITNGKTVYAAGRNITLSDSSVNMIAGATYSPGAGNSKDFAETNLTLNNVTAASSVYGGSYYTDHVGTANLTINGGTYNGRVVGGSTCDDYNENIVVDRTNVVITAGTFKQEVYGGGNAASTVKAGSSLTISGGTFSNSVFGGGSGRSVVGDWELVDGIAVEKAGSPKADSSLTISGGTFNTNGATGGVYGGNAHGFVTGNASVTITGDGTVSIRGPVVGGNNASSPSGRAANYIGGNTYVTIENANAVIAGHVFGGSSSQKYDEDGGSATLVKGDSHVTITAGTVQSASGSTGRVYGGGCGIEGGLSVVEGTAYVTIGTEGVADAENKLNVQNVYGSGNSYSSVGNAVVEIHDSVNRAYLADENAVIKGTASMTVTADIRNGVAAVLGGAKIGTATTGVNTTEIVTVKISGDQSCFHVMGSGNGAAVYGSMGLYLDSANLLLANDTSPAWSELLVGGFYGESTSEVFGDALVSIANSTIATKNTSKKGNIVGAGGGTVHGTSRVMIGDNVDLVCKDIAAGPSWKGSVGNSELVIDGANTSVTATSISGGAFGSGSTVLGDSSVTINAGTVSVDTISAAGRVWLLGVYGTVGGNAAVTVNGGSITATTIHGGRNTVTGTSSFIFNDATVFDVSTIKAFDVIEINKNAMTFQNLSDIGEIRFGAGVTEVAFNNVTFDGESNTLDLTGLQVSASKISMGAGDDVLKLGTGSKLTGTVDLGAGKNTLSIVNGADYSGATFTGVTRLEVGAGATGTMAIDNLVGGVEELCISLDGRSYDSTEAAVSVTGALDSSLSISIEVPAVWGGAESAKEIILIRNLTGSTGGLGIDGMTITVFGKLGKISGELGSAQVGGAATVDFGMGANWGLRLNGNGDLVFYNDMPQTMAAFNEPSIASAMNCLATENIVSGCGSTLDALNLNLDTDDKKQLA